MEANGLAAFILNNFGEYGKQAFAIYKFLMVMLIIVICEVVANKSVKKARLIMLLGCTIYFGVVLYECFLVYKFIELPSIHATADPGLINYLFSFVPRLS